MSAGMMERRHGIRVPNRRFAALAPSLRQYELDQVQRVTALPSRRSDISAPCRDTPGECVKCGQKREPCQRGSCPSSFCERHLELLAGSQSLEALIADTRCRHGRHKRLWRIVYAFIGQLEGAEMVADSEGRPAQAEA